MQIIKILIIALFYITISAFPTKAQNCPSSPPPTALNGILHVRLTDGSGLGNRIKKIISYLRYYKPKHLNLYWETKGSVTTPFSDLFAPAWKTELTEFNAPEIINIFPYNETLRKYVDNFVLLTARDEFKSTDYFFLEQRYNNTPPEIIKKILPYFKALHPSPAVAARIKEIKLTNKTVAVQIRNAPDWQFFFNANEPHEVFFALMDKYPPDTLFFLSAMSKETAAPFYARYPNRIMELPHKNYKSMIDATADMFLLGLTKEAIYAKNSSFSEVGWWLGGAKTKVTLAGSDNHGAPKLPHPKLCILETFPK